MRQLKIDLSELEIAFESSSDMITYYLDLETGEVFFVREEESSLLDEIYESYYNERTETVDWEAAFEQEGISDWQRDVVLEADRVRGGSSSRYLAVPWEGSHEGYRDMEAFIETLRSSRLQERLEDAIRGRGAFRKFKDVLLNYPAERERWFQLKQERVHERINDWLEENEITLANDD
jgi:hypothetical protein